jgi:tetratricopeptide (TPR) repeat protein
MPRKTPIFALAVLLALPLSAHADKLDDDLAAARALLIAGKDDQAADKLDALEDSAKIALTKNPSNAHANYILGSAAMYNGHDTLAARSLDAALKLEPASPLYLLARAQLAIYQNKPTDALPFAQKVLDADPKNIPAWETRGEAHRDAKDFDNAVKDYQQAADLSAGTQKARELSILGDIFNQQSKPDQAIALYEKALDADPTLTPTRVNIGQIYQLQHDYTKALDAYTKVLAATPDDWRCLAKIVQLNEALGKTPERDAARARILALNKAGKVDSAQFCREQFALDPSPLATDDKKITVMVFEYFDTPAPAPLRYAFNFVEPDGKTVRKRISVVPNITPPNSFHLDCYTTAVHEVLANFTAEPTYEQTRGLVRQYIAGKLNPLSSERLPDSPTQTQPAGAAK